MAYEISTKSRHLPECPEHRRACLANKGGNCSCLTDTWWIKQRKKTCPFYKTKAMVYSQLSPELAKEALRND